jgi:hypothetical protein
MYGGRFEVDILGFCREFGFHCMEWEQNGLENARNKAIAT